MRSHVVQRTEAERLIRSFIAESLLFEEEISIGDEDSFIENGVIDSMSILELTLFVEETFHVDVHDDEVLPENFDSVRKLADYIRRKQQGRAAETA